MWWRRLGSKVAWLNLHEVKQVQNQTRKINISEQKKIKGNRILPNFSIKRRPEFFSRWRKKMYVNEEWR